jgi:hypothetical protein
MKEFARRIHKFNLNILTYILVHICVRSPACRKNMPYILGHSEYLHYGSVATIIALRLDDYHLTLFKFLLSRTFKIMHIKRWIQLLA